MAQLTSGHATDVGRARDHNEDSYVARPELGLWAVADGMGGHAAGEVASAIAVEVVAAQVEAGRDIATAIQAAHEAILQAGQEGRGESGMGCTVVALLSRGLDYQVAWVGDSRAYLWDGGTLIQLTRDHSYVQQLIDSGILTEDEAREHPQRSVISQALGIGAVDGIRVDTVAGRWGRGQQILLCSDGLTGEVEDTEIAARLGEREDLRETVAGLIRAANDNGGSDNITVALVAAPDRAPQIVPKGGTVPFDAAALNRVVAPKKKLFRRPLLLLILALAVLVAGYFAFRPASAPTPATGGSASGVLQVPADLSSDSGTRAIGPTDSLQQKPLRQSPQTRSVSPVGENSFVTQNVAPREGEAAALPTVVAPDASNDENPSVVAESTAEPALTDADLLREVKQVGAKPVSAPLAPVADNVPQLGRQRTPPKGDLSQGLNEK
nr:PP2C family serine/threonine-protein phosphatase [Geothermobacter hydrogeniphilus]